MKKLSVWLFLSCIFFLISVASSLAAFQADIDQNNDITLEDVILGLQVVAGKSPTIPEFVEDLDVNGDSQVGIAEVLDALQSVSTADSTSRHQAVIVGPLSGAGITAYRADDLSDKIDGTRQASRSTSDLAVAGTFDLSLTGIEDDAWIVVSAELGEDIDHDGNGLADTATVSNSGTLHAIARASDWRTRNITISPLSEIVWQYTQNMVSAVPAADFEIRLADLARYLVKTDIDGNGAIDWHDFLAFSPADQTHRANLKTSYDWLTTPDEDGNTILAGLLAGDEELMLSCMDEAYSYLMTRSFVPDSRYHSVKISLSVFGQGSASAGEPANLAVDSTATEPVYADHVFLPADDIDTITFTAIADTDSQILSWTGCDTISANLSQCTVAMNKSHAVVVNFGRTATQLRGTLHDLTNTTNDVYPDTITVFIPADMTDMIDEMATAAVDDFVVGDDNGGFLRRITGITQNSSTEYVLETVEASLDEVVAFGSGQLYREMTNGDLEGYIAPVNAAQSATISPTAFTGVAGVQFIPSNNPDDKRFTLIIGNPDELSAAPQLSGISYEAGVTLYEKKDENDQTIAKLDATGEISLEISFDTGVDFDYDIFNPLNTELNYFKFITILDAEQNVSLTASGPLATAEVTKKIGSFKFTPVSFFVGPVPVWIQPSVDIYLYAKGKVEAEASFGIGFQQSIEGGVLYNKVDGISLHKNFSSDFSFDSPSAGLKASIEGGIKTSPVVKLYSATGPAIPLQAYAKIASSETIEILSGCYDVKVDFSLGAKAGFEWDLSGNTKFGKLLHLKDLEEKTKVDIISKSWPIKKWNVLDLCLFVDGPHLIVDGDGLLTSINEGSSVPISTPLTVKNDGDETLNWNTKEIPAEVTVSPPLGELEPGESETVLLSVAPEGLPTGKYARKVFFYSEDSVGSILPDEQFGNTYKTIDIEVVGSITDTPAITAATSTSVGSVDFAWDFAQVGSEPLVGFQVYATTTPADDSSYSLVRTTNIYDRQERISGFSPGETYSLKVRVYSNSALGPFSTPVSVTVAGTEPLPAGTVMSPTGKIWMDRNLGASRVATSSTDSEAYGDLYQWGRGTDGHEKRDSGTTSTLSASNTPGHGNFITTSGSPYDWRSPQNHNLWQGASGINNPCPSGFRLPTSTELDTERASWSSSTSAGAYGSPLKLVVAGGRYHDNGTVGYAGSYGGYWSGTVYGTYSRYLYMYSGNAYMAYGSRAYGFSVRCLKD